MAGNEAVDLHTPSARCEACTDGYYSPLNGSLCLYCRDGVNSDHTTCELCPAGTESDLNGNCVPCTNSYYNSQIGATCLSCLGQVHNNGTLCQPCEPGSYYDTISSRCESCAQGSYTSTSGQFACIQVYISVHTSVL